MTRSSRRASAALLVVASLLAGCRQNDDPGGAESLWEQVGATTSAYRASWRRAPGYEQRRPSDAPHKDEVEIFVNPTVAAALDAKQAITSWPVGSVIVKEGFDGSDRELVAIMEKRADGWYWAEYDGSGDPLYSGRPSLCIDCHASGADGVRAFGFPKP